jgi:hypothetical protein
MGYRSTVPISSQPFTNKVVSSTYGVYGTASGATGLGDRRGMDFASIMLSETKLSSIAFQIFDARLITSRE